MALALLAGCTLSVSELDDYAKRSGPLELEDAFCGDGFSLCFDATGFTSHVDETFELTLARDSGVWAKAILSPLSYDDGEIPEDRNEASIGMANAIGDDDAHYTLRFYADHDEEHDGVYTPPPEDPELPFLDHSWIVEIDDDAVVGFEHGTDFEDLSVDPPRELEGDFSLTLRGMTSHPDETLHVWVVNTRPPGRTVGYFRLQKIPLQLCNPDVDEVCEGDDENPFTISIPGILDVGEQYKVDFFADHEVNGVYDSPPLDHSWSLTFEADRNGADLDFVHTGEFDELIPQPTLD